MFRKGLKDPVKDELIRNRAICKDLEQLINRAIDLDDKLYERSMEKRHGNILGRPNGYNGYPKINQGRKEMRDPDAMDQQYNKLYKKGKPKGSKDNKKVGILCYACN